MELKEKLAKIEHERWSDWMSHLFSRGVLLPDGNFVINKNDFDRWSKQTNGTYEMLSEADKDADRREVNRYWHLISEMEEDVKFLRSLESAGVDNWEGYEFVQEMFQE